MTAYLTKEQILERQMRTVAADAKAADPATLASEDLRDLSSAKLAELMDAGALAHLGIGARKHPRGRR